MSLMTGERMKSGSVISRPFLSLFFALFFCVGLVSADSSQKIDWRLPGGGKIKEIRYRTKPDSAKRTQLAIAAEPTPETAAATAAVSYVIDSPPVDGFVPWIVAVTTDKREDELVFDAVVESSKTGTLTATNYQTDYALAIFDTGASAHVFSHQNAVAAGLYNATYNTSNTTSITGVTGSVDASISMPIGLFVQGLSVLQPGTNATLPSTAGLVGESNVSIILGDDNSPMPDLATAIGTPMSVYYTTHIRNDNPITITRNGTEYTGPDIHIYSQSDPCVPSYPNTLPLELRPLGATSVQYISLDLSGGLEFKPTSPSIIIGTGSQSLFFVYRVMLREGTNTFTDYHRFMLDTGAQISVISSRIAADLELDIKNPDFEVDIQGVTGDTIVAPGFNLDWLKMPTLGQKLEYTNVPVVLLDISSPEGGKLDGIIGMNLFTQYNLIIRGGGMFLQDDPALEFQRIAGSIAGDIAPSAGDGKIDMADLGAYSAIWMSNRGSANWNPKADIAPLPTPDGAIDIQDLVRLAENWLTGAY